MSAYGASPTPFIPPLSNTPGGSRRSRTPAAVPPPPGSNPAWATFTPGNPNPNNLFPNARTPPPMGTPYVPNGGNMPLHHTGPANMGTPGQPSRPLVQTEWVGFGNGTPGQGAPMGLGGGGSGPGTPAVHGAATTGYIPPASTPYHGTPYPSGFGQFTPAATFVQTGPPAQGVPMTPYGPPPYAAQSPWVQPSPFMQPGAYGGHAPQGMHPGQMGMGMGGMPMNMGMGGGMGMNMGMGMGGGMGMPGMMPGGMGHPQQQQMNMGMGGMPGMTPHMGGGGMAQPPGGGGYFGANPMVPQSDRSMTLQGGDHMPVWTEGKAYGVPLTPNQAHLLKANLEVNPLLSPPTDSDQPFLKWNMLFESHYCQLSTDRDRTSWSKGRNSPATFPRLTSLRVSFHPRYSPQLSLPWSFTVKAADPQYTGVTCGEVIDSLSVFMQKSSGQAEFGALDHRRQVEVSQSYRRHREARDGVPGGRLGDGLRRLDFLSAGHVFGGVEKAVVGMEGVAALLPCTFWVRCVQNYVGAGSESPVVVDSEDLEE